MLSWGIAGIAIHQLEYAEATSELSWSHQTIIGTTTCNEHTQKHLLWSARMKKVSINGENNA
jgi:hypothetical protein